MHLTKFTDLGLRVIMRVGSSPDQRHTVTTLAEEVNASSAHIAKVVSKLGSIGVITSTRGRTGGVTLNDEARAFSLGHVLRELEGTAPVVNCNEPPCPFHVGAQLGDGQSLGVPALSVDDSACSGSPVGAEPMVLNCMLRGKLAAAQQAFFAALDTTTLGELVTHARQQLPMISFGTE